MSMDLSPAGASSLQPLLPRVGWIAHDAIKDGQVICVEIEKVGADDARRDALRARAQVLCSLRGGVSIHFHTPEFFAQRQCIARWVKALLECCRAREEHARATTGVEHTIRGLPQA